jgi:hypothetical protein
MQRIEVHVKEQIDRDWSDWLGGLTVTPTAEGETILAGAVRDQSALYGLLNKLSNLGIHLISVSCASSTPNNTAKQILEGSSSAVVG